MAATNPHLQQAVVKRHLARHHVEQRRAAQHVCPVHDDAERVLPCGQQRHLQPVAALVLRDAQRQVLLRTTGAWWVGGRGGGQGVPWSEACVHVDGQRRVYFTTLVVDMNRWKEGEARGGGGVDTLHAHELN